MSTARTFIALAILIPCLGLCGLSQETSTVKKSDDLYSQALAATLAEMDKQWGRVGMSNVELETRVRTDYHHMLVSQHPEITSGMPSQFGDFHVEFLDRQAQIDRFLKLQKEYAVLEIHPIQNDGPNLKISLTVSWIKYHKRRLIYAFSDWSDVEFHYDCDQQKFVLSTVKLGGI